MHAGRCRTASSSARCQSQSPCGRALRCQAPRSCPVRPCLRSTCLPRGWRISGCRVPSPANGIHPRPRCRSSSLCVPQGTASACCTGAPGSSASRPAGHRGSSRFRSCPTRPRRQAAFPSPPPPARGTRRPAQSIRLPPYSAPSAHSRRAPSRPRRRGRPHQAPRPHRPHSRACPPHSASARA